MKRVLVPLAPGCEDMEAVTIIDILRRAEIEVVAAGLSEGGVTGSRGVTFIPDALLADVADQEFDMVALPGGIPGADNLAADAVLESVIRRHEEQDRFIAAVCAAPKVLARHGVLSGKHATAFPGVLEQEAHPQISSQAVVRDGNVITSRAAGTAMDFALTLVESLEGTEKRKAVEAGLVRTVNDPAAT